MTDAVVRRSNPWWVAVVSGMASYIDAAAIISFGSALVIYQAAIGLVPGQVGLASGSLTFGIAIGALVGGRLGDRFGRRPVFTVTMIAIILGSVLLIVADGFTVVLIGSLLVGLATGADLPVSLATIAEAAEPTQRGRLLGFSNLLWLVGVIVAVSLGVAVGNLGRVGGQILFGHLAVVALLVLVGRLTIPESKDWAAARAERRAGAATVRAERASVLVLLRAPYRTPFLALLAFYALTNLAANTTGQFGTYLLVNVAGVDVSTASVLTLVTLPIGVLGYLWFMKIADSPKRYGYFAVGGALWVVGLLVPAIFGISIVTYLTAGVLGVVGASFAFEGIMKVWTQEQFPTLLRTTAQGSVIAVARLLAAVLASVTPLIVAAGPNVLYVVLTVVVAAGIGIAAVVFRSRDRHDEFAAGASLEGVVAAPAAR